MVCRLTPKSKFISDISDPDRCKRAENGFGANEKKSNWPDSLYQYVCLCVCVYSGADEWEDGVPRNA